MKYLFFCIALLFCRETTHAQFNTQRQDTIRWFVGKWIGNNTFRIDSALNGKCGSGGTIKIKPGGTLEFNTAESKKFDDKLKDVIKKLDDDEKEIGNTVKEDEGMYQFELVSQSKKELDSLKEEFKQLIIHPDEAPANPPPPANTPSENERDRVCASWEPEYHRIIDFYNAHRRDHHPHFDLPAPPVADYFNCWGCDTARQNEFKRATDEYVNNFFTSTTDDIKLLLGMVKAWEQMGLAGGHSIYHNLFADQSHSVPAGPCAYINYDDMCGAIIFYTERMQQMAAQLWKDYSKKDSWGSVVPVIKICLKAAQLKQALVGEVDNEDFIAGNLVGPLENLNDSISKRLFKAKDFKLLGSIPFIISIQQQIAALAGESTDEHGFHIFGWGYSPRYSISDIIAFPIFKLTVELETKVGENGNYNIVHLKSNSKIIAVPDDKECVKFILSKKEAGKIKANIIDNEAISPYPHATYVGTKTYESVEPILKIRFCSVNGVPTGDSIYLASFLPQAPDKGNWEFQGKMLPSGINQADKLFVNINDVKNDARNYSPDVDQKKLEDIKANSMEMAARIRAMQAAGNTDPMKMAEMVKQMMNNSNTVVETKASEITRIRLPLKVINLDKVLINQRFDAKEINPSFSQPIVYAYLTIKLQHDPGRSDDDE